MKTKLQFLKENWILAALWNIQYMILLFIPIHRIFDEIFMIIGTMTILYFFLIINSINDWYNDYRFEELERKIKKLINGK